jgi:hypothetical protein
VRLPKNPVSYRGVSRPKASLERERGLGPADAAARGELLVGGGDDAAAAGMRRLLGGQAGQGGTDALVHAAIDPGALAHLHLAQALRQEAHQQQHRRRVVAQRLLDALDRHPAQGRVLAGHQVDATLALAEQLRQEHDLAGAEGQRHHRRAVAALPVQHGVDAAAGEEGQACHRVAGTQQGAAGRHPLQRH